ncbi:MAG: imidazoleglycerol-phosphate dehydratase HisB [Verrucomicrobia bacterium]|nr:imidazoleglycerol-phosphate dehydratase HisB [Verrucomicrobiota bacterium]
MKRIAKVKRDTAETKIDLALNLDGRGNADVKTGIPFFDHMLSLLARHSLCDLRLRCKGDIEIDFHHTVEDCGIALGQAFAYALGDKRGIRRYGWSRVPMDEARIEATLDFGGRPVLVYEGERLMKVGGAVIGRTASERFTPQLVEEFLRAFANNAGMNLHVVIQAGRDAHHMIEGVFKALAKALDLACQRDPRVKGVPSTKGTLSR